MLRRSLIALSLGLGLAAGAAGSAFAQSAPAKAAVDAAKASGVVGEQGDGFLGFVSGAPGGGLAAAVAQINAGRAKAYADIAAKSGVSPAAAGEATAQQLIARLPSGAYYRPVGGGWERK